MRKPTNVYAKTSCAVIAQVISAFVYATQIGQSLFLLLNPNFQASSLLLSLYRPVFVGLGREPKWLVLSCKGSCNNEGTNNILRPLQHNAFCSVTNGIRCILDWT